MDYAKLSDGQIDWLLNYLLQKAYTPLAHASNFLKVLASELLAQPYNDSRRKISAIDKNAALVNLFMVIHAKKPEDQIKYFVGAVIERNLIHEALLYVTERVKYKELSLEATLNSKRLLKIEAFERFIGKTGNLFSAMSESIYWLRKYESVRNHIVISYEKMARISTDSILRGTTLNIDKSDLYKNMMMGVQRAVDKFSSKKGTLQNYIQMWMRNSNTNPLFPHEYGNSFSVSAGERRRITNAINSGEYALSNLSVELKDAVHVMDYQNPEKIYEDESQGIKFSHDLAKMPNAKFAFLAGGIPYYLSEKEKKILQSA